VTLKTGQIGVSERRQHNTRSQTRPAEAEALALAEEKHAVAESRKGHEAKDQAHCRACVDDACGHPAHVLARRELRRETPKDRRHLAACALEDPDCEHESHLLPPHPLAAAEEFCCEHECFPRHDVRSITECRYLPAKVRARRQAEYRARGGAAFGVGGGFALEPFGVTTSPLSESTVWAWRGRRVYDPASAPLRE